MQVMGILKVIMNIVEVHDQLGFQYEHKDSIPKPAPQNVTAAAHLDTLGLAMIS